jgi:lipoate-protein ligase A
VTGGSVNETWRIIDDPPQRGSLNMAADFAILKSLSRGGCPPTLRLYRWEPPAVTIGYFQVIEDELNEGECVKDGVPVIRRITGGGAVFHEHEITYSLCIPVNHPLAYGTVLDSYRRICEPVIRALRFFGLNAAYHPVNDIMVDDRKISGSAQTRRNGVLLQHGTVLTALNTQKMFRYLKVPKEKTEGRVAPEPASRVVSLHEYMGDRSESASFREEFTTQLRESFSLLYGIDFTAGRLSQEEGDTADSVEESVFSNPAWNRDRNAEL